MVGNENSGRRPLKVNEHFFDLEGRTVRELKEFWYILGISIPTYSQRLLRDRYTLNMWQSSSEELIERVKSSLGMDRGVSVTRYKSTRPNIGYLYNYQLFTANQRIYDTLGEMGLGVPKAERRFPDKVGNRYIDHLIGGFFDANADIDPDCITLHFNALFARDLYSELVDHAGVNPNRDVRSTRFIFGKEDSIRIRGFRYRDWDFVEEHGLYLPLKKKLFEQIESPKTYKHVGPTDKSFEKMARVEKLIRRGIPPRVVAEVVGYSAVAHLYKAYKHVTGITLGEFLAN